MKYELYADVWFLTNFTMDSIALFLAGKLMRQPIRFKRLLLGSFVGTMGSMILFWTLKNYTCYQILVHFLVNPLMVYLCYPAKSKREFLSQWAVTYLAFILLGGVLAWSMQGRVKSGYFVLCLAGAGLFLGIVGKILRHFRQEKGTIYDLLLVTREGNLSVKGFYDTGNLLTDPLGNRPVHIVKREILQEQIQKEQLPIRLIPFHSLGQESGLLEAVTLEGMYIVREKHPLYLKKPVFGLADEKLFQSNSCDVILNGKSMEN